MGLKGDLERYNEIAVEMLSAKPELFVEHVTEFKARERKIRDQLRAIESEIRPRLKLTEELTAEASNFPHLEEKVSELREQVNVQQVGLTAVQNHLNNVARVY